MKLSHALNTDVGNLSYRNFNPDEWEALFEKLENIKYLYMNNESADLTALSLNSFINKNSAVFVVVPGTVYLWQRLGKGFYNDSNFNVYDSYSNTSDVNEMIDDQINKMNLYSRSHYFLLSWTLTQSGLQAATCNLPGVDSASIRELAATANENLAFRLYPHIGTNYPNIICIDDVRDSRVAVLAMAVNQRLFSKRYKLPSVHP